MLSLDFTGGGGSTEEGEAREEEEEEGRRKGFASLSGRVMGAQRCKYGPLPCLGCEKGLVEEGTGGERR